MAQKLNLKICHLYPDTMDTYGDTGNVVAIIQRCKWRGIQTQLITNNLNDPPNFKNIDIFFFGGGQDKIQSAIGKDLQKKKDGLLQTIENNVVLLSICGGYQLLQNYFKTSAGKTIKGVGIFDAHTEGSGDRMIQNLLIKFNRDIEQSVKTAYRSNTNKFSSKLIGFENHSGKTYLNGNTKPLGYVIKGSGNNGEDKTEGAIYKNAFGCYLHGSLLPKNPHFADYLIFKALERKYKIVKLKPLNDNVEWQAHNQAVNRSRSQS